MCIYLKFWKFAPRYLAYGNLGLVDKKAEGRSGRGAGERRILLGSIHLGDGCYKVCLLIKTKNRRRKIHALVTFPSSKAKE